ncbi:MULTISPECIES: TrbG/VirB9 family P-type conjugative transfer protein [unclassified Paraburkholderia]|uniref:TrbG/VirB9 family P-type conjugative transfer protein n=1 Tax=unclassified Paraburkholderia TaxID=2615204 RepID=UPI002AB1DE64|nr:MULTISPECIES: TrbG/VirB9 family P-type conjugative transfer protein [unclassified Paraburkholderia]
MANLNFGKRRASRSVRHCLFVTAALAACPVFAATGLDFGYRIDGPTNLRPTLVFNDGEDTYIQPSGNARVSADGAHQDGPYLRIPGIPDNFTVRAGAISMRVEHETLPSGPTSPRAYAASRPIVLETNAAHSQRRPDDFDGATTGVPHGTDAIVPRQAPAGDMRASARMEGGTEPPIIGGPMMQTPVTTQSVAPGGYANPAGITPVVRPLSYLAARFGADGIRDGFGDTIQIHFRFRPNPDIQFASADGKHLEWFYDATSNVMTVSATPKFLVRDGRSSVVVSRVTDDTFLYPPDNAAGLNRVFEDAGAVYLEVAAGTKRVTVRQDGKVLPGRQKGRYYRVTGAADNFVVDADGFDVTVTRARTVHFTDQDGSES